jgi:hypothetical protein
MITSSRVTRLFLASVACVFLGLSVDLKGQNDPVEPGRESQFVATPIEDVSGGGRFFWVIFEEPDTDETEADGWSIDDAVVARGTMGYEGIDAIILAPRTNYRMWAIYAENLSVGSQSFRTPRSGETFEIPRMGFYSFVDDEDEDNDLIGTIGEFIIGTSSTNPDTDGDGVNDGAEVIQGLNPLDGLIAATGVVGSAPTPGIAHDICAANNIVAVACLSAGVTVFNVEASDAPTRIAQVDTPGEARAVDCFGSLLAVADGPAGLTIIDIGDPAAARITLTVRMAAPAETVSTLGNFAFVGLANGNVAAVDMFTGEVSDLAKNLAAYGSVQDLGVIDSYLYVLQVGRLSVFEVIDGELEFVTGISSPGGIGAGRRRLRLFLGNDFAFSTFVSGFNIFNLTNPAAPTRVEDFTNNARGWKQIVSNGDGLGIAAVSPNSTNDGPHHVSLFDVSDPQNAVFISEYPTPGLAAAVALFNGVAYVADSSEGLQVINYLAFDSKGVPPSLTMFVDSNEGTVEEGKVLRIEVEASDDVQVQRVNFYIDGEPVFTDGNYPYAFNMIAPLIEDTETGTFVVHAEAIDTGGNLAAVDPIMLTLVPDATPPRVRFFSPRAGSFVGSMQTVSIAFNELLDPTTLTSSTLRLSEAGPDGVINTTDDVVIPTTITYEEATMRAVLDPGSLLAPGLYQAAVRPPAGDLAGNAFERIYTSAFRVFDFVDTDRDGVPDDVEEDLGLDPNNPDTNGNDIPDGLEDFDGDGLPLAGEILLGRDPTEKDSDENGIEDGDEDLDFDGLSDGEEIRNGTDPNKVDSDGDGIDDPTEIASGFDPNDPGSRFDRVVFSGIVAYINGAFANAGDILDYTVSSPVVSFVNGIVESSSPDIGVSATVSSPVVSFINGLVEPLPVDESDRYTVSSPLVSYVNGIVGTAEGNLSVASPIISYRNN